MGSRWEEDRAPLRKAQGEVGDLLAQLDEAEQRGEIAEKGSSAIPKEAGALGGWYEPTPYRTPRPTADRDEDVAMPVIPPCPDARFWAELDEHEFKIDRNSIAREDESLGIKPESHSKLCRELLSWIIHYCTNLHIEPNQIGPNCLKVAREFTATWDVQTARRKHLQGYVKARVDEIEREIYPDGPPAAQLPAPAPQEVPKEQLPAARTALELPPPSASAGPHLVERSGMSEPPSSEIDPTDPLEVISKAFELIRCLRSSEPEAGGIRPAPEASDLEVQLYNLIHGAERIDAKRPRDYHLAQRWGRELLELIQRTHAGLFAIMAGSGCLPRWTESGWTVRQSDPIRMIPTELLAQFEHAIDELERVATLEKSPPTVQIRTHTFRDCYEELEIDPDSGAWRGDWVTEEGFTMRRMIARTSDGRWLGAREGGEYPDGSFRLPFDENTPIEVSEWFSRYYEGEPPPILDSDIISHLYINTIGGLIERIEGKELAWMNENRARRTRSLADALKCNLEPSEETGFQCLKVFAKQQFDSEIITREIAHKILERVCRVRRILPEEARKLTLTETADVVEGSTGLKCPRCGGPLDDREEGSLSCRACRTEPTQPAGTVVVPSLKNESRMEVPVERPAHELPLPNDPSVLVETIGGGRGHDIPIAPAGATGGEQGPNAPSEKPASASPMSQKRAVDSADEVALAKALRKGRKKKQALLVEYMTDKDSAEFEDLTLPVHGHEETTDDAVEKNARATSDSAASLGYRLRYESRCGWVYKEIAPE